MNKSLLVICKRLTKSLVFLLALFSILSLAFAEDKIERDDSTEGRPQISISNSVFDFGIVSEGETVAHIFEISNTGTAPLLITSINPACGCTSSTLEKSEILPKENGQIEVKFHTKGFFGQKEKTIRVNTNDPLTPSVTLAIRGAVNRDISATPSRIFWGKVKKGSSASQEVLISGLNAEVKVTEVVSTSKYIRIERDPARDDFLRVSLLKDLPLGILREDVLIKTSSKKRPIITLPIFATVQGDLELFPSDVSFGLVDQGLVGDIKKNVVLRNLSGSAIEVVEVKTDNNSIEAFSTSGGAADEKIITVVLKQGVKGVIKAKVTVVTDHSDPEQREVTIPVYAIVSRVGSSE